VSVGALVCVAGLVAWPWTGEWRWAATGLGVLLACGLIGAVLDHRLRRSHQAIRECVTDDGYWHDGDTVHCGCGDWSLHDPDPRARFDGWIAHRDADHPRQRDV
jgi:hypothetical protein